MENLRKNLNVYKKKQVLFFSKLNFLGIKKLYDVYNPSSVFEFCGHKFIFGRVEGRNDWANSEVMLFRHVKKNMWRKMKNFKSLKLEDPFIKKIGNEFILGGVFVKKSFGKINFRTLFYKGKSPFSLRKFAEGPWGMKDIRLIGLNDGRIAVFTRPRGGKYGRGKIGFFIINSLEQLNENVISNAKLIDFPFSEGEWGGVNDIIQLGKNSLGVLGHIAYSSKIDSRFYYPISFIFNTKSKKITNLKVLFTRNDLPFELPKNRYLYNVIFPGGIICENNKARIYAGIGDNKSYEILIKNPFQK